VGKASVARAISYRFAQDDFSFGGRFGSLRDRFVFCLGFIGIFGVGCFVYYP
jgi:hypothetical protein